LLALLIIIQISLIVRLLWSFFITSFNVTLFLLDLNYYFLLFNLSFFNIIRSN